MTTTSLGKLLLFLAALGGMVALVRWSRPVVRRGGALALESPVEGALDATSPRGVVPGQSSATSHVDRWTIDLATGQTVTFLACGRRAVPGGAAFSPFLLAHGPGGAADQYLVAPPGVFPSQRALVLTPAREGRYALYVHTPRDARPGRYQLTVLRGDRPSRGCPY